MIHACCGHGLGETANGEGHLGYIFFANGITVRFDSVLDVEKLMVSKYNRFNEGTTAPKLLD